MINYNICCNDEVWQTSSISVIVEILLNDTSNDHHSEKSAAVNTIISILKNKQ